METFGWLTWSVAAACLAVNAGIWGIAARRVRSWRTLRRDRPDPARWPSVHVFVCLKGALPEIRRTVLGLDLQDYPGEFRVTFVTEGAAPADTAAEQLLEILPATRRSDHAVAGQVLEAGVRCAQKNYNLLAGIRHAQEVHGDADVYAFCDGDLQVQGDWLREMVRPIAAGEGEASTSLHYTTPSEHRILGALHGMAESAQSLGSLVCRGATWGGSMAIRSREFHRLGLPEVWSQTCVDDMTMSRVLRKARIRVTPVPQFLVSARSDIGSYRGFVRWLGRQFFFVKVYLPSRWHLLWTKCALDLAAIWLATYHVSHAILSGEWAAGAPAGWLAVAAAGAAFGGFHVFRYLLPDPPPFRSWVGATLLVHGAGILACADATFRRKRLIWSDLTYHLERGGRVVTVTGNGTGNGNGTEGSSAAKEHVPEKAVA